MSVQEAVIWCWMLGIVLFGGAIARSCACPNREAKAAVRVIRQEPVVAAVMLVAILLTWPVSIPLLYYQGCRDERKERK